MKTPKRILMVMPSFPYPESGAEQIDRACGIRQLVRLGYEVTVIAKVVEWADRNALEVAAENMGVRATFVPYRYSNRRRSWREKIFGQFGKLRNPLFFDGAAYEFAESGMKKAVAHELDNFKPDIVWFEYTYLWPLYGMVHTRDISIVTRSANFEPEHFLEEDGRTIINYVKYIPKFLGERIMLRLSDAVFAITPKEKAVYERLGAKNVFVLPLRGLPPLVNMPRQAVVDQVPLHVVFMGSSYAVVHNRKAAEFLVQEIIPSIQKHAPGAFVFHITGAKLPPELAEKAVHVGCRYEGYVPNLGEFLSHIDIALIPSLYGAGMQQKVFEPISRGIPTITSPRAIAGYPFESEKHYKGAVTAVEYVNALLSLRSTEVRLGMSSAASHESVRLFSRETLDAIVQNAIAHL